MNKRYEKKEIVYYKNRKNHEHKNFERNEKFVQSFLSSDTSSEGS